MPAQNYGICVLFEQDDLHWFIHKQILLRKSRKYYYWKYEQNKYKLSEQHRFLGLRLNIKQLISFSSAPARVLLKQIKIRSQSNSKNTWACREYVSLASTSNLERRKLSMPFLGSIYSHAGDERLPNMHDVRCWIQIFGLLGLGCSSYLLHTHSESSAQTCQRSA